MNEIIEKIPLDQIVPDPRNHKHGGRSPEELAGLADSIKAHGVQEPAIVRPVDAAASGAPYMLVAGDQGDEEQEAEQPEEGEADE